MQLAAIASAGGGKGVKGSIPNNQTAAQFEKSLVGLPPGERVAQIKQAASAIAAPTEWSKIIEFRK